MTENNLLRAVTRHSSILHRLAFIYIRLLLNRIVDPETYVESNKSNNMIDYLFVSSASNTQVNFLFVSPSLTISLT